MNSTEMRRLPLVGLISIVVAVFLFRLYYGLNLNFWHEDTKHVYLLGLDLFATHQWPYFGADVIHTQTQIAGALQSFLVGLPLFIAAIPESPLIFVNLLSITALLIFAAYLARRFQRASFVFIFLWLASLPWTLEISTHIYNPSYQLLPEILFFIGFFEVIPSLSTAWLARHTSALLIGFSLAFLAQIHLSWPLLIPFLVLALPHFRTGWCKNVAHFLIGAAVPLVLVLPTFLNCGWGAGLKAGTTNTGLNIENAAYIVNNAMRLISYGTYETVMFLGETMEERKDLLLGNWWLIPLFLVITIAGMLQIAGLVFGWYTMAREGRDKCDSMLVKLLIFALLSSWAIFLFSSRPPISRNFYLLFPLLATGSFAVIDYFFDRVWVRRGVIGLVALSFCYHGLVGVARQKTLPAQTLYSNREIVQKAIKEKNPSLFETPRYSIPCHRL